MGNMIEWKYKKSSRKGEKEREDSGGKDIKERETDRERGERERGAGKRGRKREREKKECSVRTTIPEFIFNI